jgi:hypothetical protein
MTRIERLMCDAATELGLTDVHIVQGRHPMVRGWVGERRVTYAFPLRPCPYRGEKNAVAGLRRTIHHVEALAA